MAISCRVKVKLSGALTRRRSCKDNAEDPEIVFESAEDPEIVFDSDELCHPTRFEPPFEFR